MPARAKQVVIAQQRRMWLRLKQIEENMAQLDRIVTELNRTYREIRQSMESIQKETAADQS